MAGVDLGNIGQLSVVCCMFRQAAVHTSVAGHNLREVE